MLSACQIVHSSEREREQDSQRVPRTPERLWWAGMAASVRAVQRCQRSRGVRSCQGWQGECEGLHAAAYLLLQRRDLSLHSGTIEHGLVFARVCKTRA